MIIYHKAITASTNLDARGAAPFSVFTADCQTAGRGRLDHKWETDVGKDLAFSVVLPAHPDPVVNATLPLVIGLSIAETFDCEIKWPNDVYFQGRKLCGILCELDGANVIAGVGINVNRTEFRGDYRTAPTSLKLVFHQDFELRSVLDKVLVAIERNHREWLLHGFGLFLSRFAARDFLRGKTLSVLQTDGDLIPIVGKCEGISPEGALLIDDRKVFAGEAKIL